MLRRSILLLAALMVIGLGNVAAAQEQEQEQTPTPTQALAITPVPGVAHAEVYRLDDATPRAVVVILHGAEGGNEAGRRFGPILARMGYAAVSLPYYSPNWGEFGPPPSLPELPGSFVDIRVDQLADLRAALTGMDGVDVERFGLIGASKGAEFALIAASRYDWIDAVVAYAPTDVVWEGWGLETIESEGTRSSFSFAGQPLAFMPYRGFTEGLLAGPGVADLRAIHENGRADHPEREAEARIPVEAYAGELMVIAGDKDAQWNAGRAARNIVASRAETGRGTEAAIYPDAGHDLVGDGGPRQDPRSGGSAEADAAARADAWPRVVAFLSRALAPTYP